MGDPAGIGPELCLQAIQAPAILDKCIPVVFGDSSVLKIVASACSIKAKFKSISMSEWNNNPSISEAVVVDCGTIDGTQVEPGQIQKSCGRVSYKYIKTAAKAAIDGRIIGMATAPIHKEALRLAGIVLPGHTEILAELTGTKTFCMMMASDLINVSLATIHVGYAEVPGLISTQRIIRVIGLTAHALRHLGIRSPRITVCGLNPHSGENGLFGNEEQNIIEPAVADAQLNGLNVEGPTSPDTAFMPAIREKTDAYVAMYHDQGLIPFKMLAFDKGVNVSLGLPIVRTSVDHGTAFDIAWQGKASPLSMIESILWALRLAGM
ncbi:MAG: 4-hydroxythreonine-4-phosphate dehydrogenase PdxA [Kiritimatiellae bacterium]|nr:4-hydroxythreonine-4-phosphate dehydrogenase PdxA [Kiritimatiellia bacterium]